MTINDRISRVISYSGLSASEFADAIEVQRSSISHIASGRNKPSLDFLIKIKNYFPEIEWEWLITGNGIMKSENNPLEKKQRAEETKLATLPDLFAMIDDDNFGITESEDRTKKSNLQKTTSELPISVPIQDQSITINSQELGPKILETSTQVSENQNITIKKIVFFYSNGTFELYEP